VVEFLIRPYTVEKQVAKAEGFVKQMKARHKEAQLVLRKLKSSRAFIVKPRFSIHILQEIPVGSEESHPSGSERFQCRLFSPVDCDCLAMNCILLNLITTLHRTS